MSDFNLIVSSLVPAALLPVSVAALYSMMVRHTSLSPDAAMDHAVVERFDSEAERSEYRAALQAQQQLRCQAALARYRQQMERELDLLVGIHNRFEGEWLGASGQPGRGHLRWSTGPGETQAPLLAVRDKGRLHAGQRVSWIIPGEGIALLPPDNRAPGIFAARVQEARRIGDLLLASLDLDDVPGATMRLHLSGLQRQGVEQGSRVAVRLDLDLVHVMPTAGSTARLDGIGQRGA